MGRPSYQHPDFMVLLFSRLFRSEELLDRISSYLRPEDLYAPTERGWALSWAIVRDFWAEHRQCIPRAVLDIEIDTRLDGMEDDYLGDDGAEQLCTDLDLAFETGTVLPDSWLIDQLSHLVKSRRIHALAQGVAEAPAEQIDELMAELAVAHSGTQLSTGTEVMAFTPGHEQLNQIPRSPCGVGFIDTLLGGGARSGEVYGLLGPTGRGKTALAVQMTWSKVRREEHCAYFAYEFPFDPELTQRFYAYAADIPASRIEGRNFDQLNPDDRARIQDETRKYGAYMHAVNMINNRNQQTGSGGMQEFRSKLLEYRKRGTPISFAVIDQMIPLANRYLAAVGKDPGESMRLYLQSAVDEAMRIADELECSILLLHQMSPEAGNRSPASYPKWGDAAECRSFAFWMSNCLALGTGDERGLGWCCSTKARGTAVNGLIVKLEGADYRFVHEPGRYQLAYHRFVETGAQYDNKRGASTKEAVSGSYDAEQQAGV